MDRVSLYAPELIGVLLPPVIEILNRDIPQEKQKERFLATLAICFVVALLLKWNSLVLGNVEQLLVSFGLIFTESQAVYRLYFKDSYFRAKLKARLDKINSSNDEPLG